MIVNQQKFLLHHYARTARLQEPSYRNILRTAAGVSSARDARFDQSGFERAMALLETTLFQRVEAGKAPDPVSGCDRWIRSEYYWRNRLPRAGFVNSRQAHRIEELWDRLKPLIPPEQRSADYLLRIVHKATGRLVGYSALTRHEAACLLDALSDRLAHALTSEARP